MSEPPKKKSKRSQKAVSILMLSSHHPHTISYHPHTILKTKTSENEDSSKGEPPPESSKKKPSVASAKSSQIEESSESEPTPESSTKKSSTKYRCPWCHAYLRTLGDRYKAKKNTAFRCPSCTSYMSYGVPDDTQFFRCWPEDEDDELDENSWELESNEKCIDDLVEGDSVRITIGSGRTKDQITGWLTAPPSRMAKSKNRGPNTKLISSTWQPKRPPPIAATSRLWSFYQLEISKNTKSQ